MVYLNGYCYNTKIEGPQINKIKNYSELGGNLDIELSYSTKVTRAYEGLC
jgi:hypothetical protein